MCDVLCVLFPGYYFCLFSLKFITIREKKSYSKVQRHLKFDIHIEQGSAVQDVLHRFSIIVLKKKCKKRCYFLILVWVFNSYSLLSQTGHVVQVFFFFLHFFFIAKRS